MVVCVSLCIVGGMLAFVGPKLSRWLCCLGGSYRFVNSITQSQSVLEAIHSSF